MIPSTEMANQHTNPLTGKIFKQPRFALTDLKPDNWSDPRPCWYCGVQVIPNHRRHWQKHFCCEDHRKAFNKYGYMPFEKLMLALREEIRKEVARQLNGDK